MKEKSCPVCEEIHGSKGKLEKEEKSISYHCLDCGARVIFNSGV